MRWSAKVSGINLTYLENMCGDDKAFISKVVNAYLIQIPESLKNIEVGLTNLDAKILMAAAHKVRSSSQFIGAFSLAELAEDLENHCKFSDSFSLVYFEEKAREILVLFEEIKPQLIKLAGR